jgi:hypothetical protein
MTITYVLKLICTKLFGNCNIFSTIFKHIPDNFSTTDSFECESVVHWGLDSHGMGESECSKATIATL